MQALQFHPGAHNHVSRYLILVNLLVFLTLNLEDILGTEGVNKLEQTLVRFSARTKDWFRAFFRRHGWPMLQALRSMPFFLAVAAFSFLIYFPLFRLVSDTRTVLRSYAISVIVVFCLTFTALVLISEPSEPESEYVQRTWIAKRLKPLYVALYDHYMFWLVLALYPFAAAVVCEFVFLAVLRVLLMALVAPVVLLMQLPLALSKVGSTTGQKSFVRIARYILTAAILAASFWISGVKNH